MTTNNTNYHIVTFMCIVKISLMWMSDVTMLMLHGNPKLHANLSQFPANVLVLYCNKSFIKKCLIIIILLQKHQQLPMELWIFMFVQCKLLYESWMLFELVNFHCLTATLGCPVTPTPSHNRRCIHSSHKLLFSKYDQPDKPTFEEALIEAWPLSNTIIFNANLKYWPLSTLVHNKSLFTAVTLNKEIWSIISYFVFVNEPFEFWIRSYRWVWCK